jgi:hypothetical protein
MLQPSLKPFIKVVHSMLSVFLADGIQHTNKIDKLGKMKVTMPLESLVTYIWLKAKQ